MFPTQSTSNAPLNSASTSKGKTFQYDFAEGDFVIKDGKLQTLSGFDGLKLWIRKVIYTEKDKFKIYGKDGSYGVKLLDYVTSDLPFPFIKAEIQRELTERLLTNDGIKSVENFIFTREKRTLLVTFTINTIYGQVKEEVKI